MNRTALVSGAVGFAAASVLSFSLVAGAQAPSAGTEPARPDKPAAGAHGSARTKPTVVLVHGAWADASGWTAVIKRLQRDGYPVVAPPNPLRGLSSDAAYIRAKVDQIHGPVILVGHSYGGAVITNAATGSPNVKALVYIAAFAPAKGDSVQSLSSTPLGKQAPPLPAEPSSYPGADGTTSTEVTLNPAKYPGVFLDDELPRAEAAALAAEQRPIAVAATTEASGTPAWQSIPSWYLVSKDDRAIAPNLERFMAKRAKAHTAETSSPHLAMVTDPAPVTRLITSAANATVR